MSRASRLFALLLATAAPAALAQGPDAGYFYGRAVSLSWAECSLSLGGGSRLTLPFLPVVAKENRTPVGTTGYTKDIAVDAAMVFVGDGIVAEGWNAYRHTGPGDGDEVDVAGKVVVLCYDCASPGVDPASEAASLGARLAAAASRGAVAAVVVSKEKEAPFLVLGPGRIPEPEIPTITISARGAAALFEAAGVGGAGFLGELRDGETPPPSRGLIPRFRLAIEGAFERVESEHFVFLFRGAELRRQRVEEVAAVHEASLEAIEEELGGPGDRPWPTGTTVYFSGYDSKIFYTHHWGLGLSDSAGVFLVWDGSEVDPGLIAHEHAHTFAALNWGRSSSFLNEGVGSHLEATVTDPDRNHDETRSNLTRGTLPPLGELLDIEVGSDELTPVAYPAAGSLVGYLIEVYGKDTLRKVFELEGRSAEARRATDTWQTALGKPLAQVEAEWHAWLRE
jgi:hypothetical protein